MTDDGRDVVLQRRGPLLVARLNRPEARNALTPAILAGVGTAIDQAESDPDVRAVVLTGTGDRAFCAGMDLRAFAGGEPLDLGEDVGTRAFARLIDGEISVPVIGAANGSAVAGGFELLLACDVIVASTAAEFGLPEVRRGLFPAGNAMFLGARIPLGIALELALTGDPIGAPRAYELGLVNALARPEDVVARACALAERIAANAPLGLAAAKELLRLGASDPARARARRGEWQPAVFNSDDAKEGARAFIEKRAPVWRGR